MAKQVRSLRTLVVCCAALYSHPVGAALFDANGGAPCCLACVSASKFIIFIDFIFRLIVHYHDEV